MTDLGSKWVVCADPPKEFSGCRIGDVLTVILSTPNLVRCSSQQENVFAQWVGQVDLAKVGWIRPLPPAQEDPVPVFCDHSCCEGKGTRAVAVVLEHFSSGPKERPMCEAHLQYKLDQHCMLVRRLPDEPAPEAFEVPLPPSKVNPFANAAPEAKPAVCGANCPKKTHGTAVCACASPQPAPPQPAAYRCPNQRPWCLENDRCGVCLAGESGPAYMEANRHGDRDEVGRAVWDANQRGWTYDIAVEMTTGECRLISVDEEARRKGPRFSSHELSYSGGNATLCRMTGRR